MLGGDSLHSTNQNFSPSQAPQPQQTQTMQSQATQSQAFQQQASPAQGAQGAQQNQLQNLLSGLSQNNQQQNQIQNLLAGLSQNNNKQSSSVSDFSSLMGGDSLSMITKLAPILGSLRKEDDTTRLLNAIRPFLSMERRKKLDEAEKMMKMMRLLPYFKDFSLF